MGGVGVVVLSCVLKARWTWLAGRLVMKGGWKCVGFWLSPGLYFCCRPCFRALVEICVAVLHFKCVASMNLKLHGCLAHKVRVA